MSQVLATRVWAKWMLVAGLSSVNAVAQSPGTFAATGSMATPRSRGHAATLLRDGRVLITGGYDGHLSLASAELYDPSTGTFTVTGAMAISRNSHSSTLLNDGRVLIAGGSYDRGISAELYDPSTGTFSPTGEMVNPGCYGQSAVLLGDGKVLLSNGVFGDPIQGGVRVRPTAPELYDPVTGTFTLAGDPGEAILGPTATLLSGGKVLLVGGWTGRKGGNTSLFDPVDGSSTLLGYLPIVSQTATSLTNGTVLIAGGWDSEDTVYDDPSIATAQIYDPSAGTFKPTGSLFEARDNHTATLLPGGLVLIAGGETFSRFLASAELYDPTTGIFIPTGAMTASRVAHTATLLTDGRVLITGGTANQYPLALLSTAELYSPPVQAVSSPAPEAPRAPRSWRR